MLRIAGLRLDSPVVRRLCIPCFRFAGLSTECPKDCIEDGGDVDVAVIGAGVVGLAVARAAALAGLDTLLLEREATHGTGISSRHSEVIHAGLYYQPGSAKARLCLEGRDALYEYATARGVPHARMGKLVVATEREQLPALAALQANAEACGNSSLEMLSSSEALALEPELSCAGALLSPLTGILDSAAYMNALLDDAVSAGATLVTHANVLGILPQVASVHTPSAAGLPPRSRLAVDVEQQEPQQPQQQQQQEQQQQQQAEHIAPRLPLPRRRISRLHARWVVNAAGLDATQLPVSGLAPGRLPVRSLAKGSYFALRSGSGISCPFRRLIYPLPPPGGLGVHLTLDLAGQARFGPDVEWVSSPQYDVDPGRAPAFYAAVRRFWPALPEGALVPAYAGVRPKLSGPGEPAADFLLAGVAHHGVPGLLTLAGIESPGLTSSLAIGKEALRMLHTDGG